MRKVTDSLGFILSTALAAAILLTTTEGRGQTSTQINLQTQVKGVLPAANGGTGITSLTSGHTYVGDGTNKPQDRAISGDVTLGNTGVVSVVKVNGVAFGASPTTNTVPVVTGLNAITYEAVPNAALANSTISVAGHVVSLGASTTLQASDLTNGVTGTGSVVLSTSPTLVTPTIGAATATTVNKVTITQPATAATLTLANNSSLITSGGNSTTFTTTGTSNLTLPAVTDTLVGKATTDTLTNKTLTNEARTTQALTDQATITWDANAGAFATVTLGGSRTLAAPTNLKTGGVYALFVTQDGTGFRTLTWNPVFKADGGATMPQPVGKLSSTTTFVFYSPDGTNLLLVSKKAQPTRTVLTSGTGATYTTPTGATRLNAVAVGGGSGGGGGNNGTPSSAGGDTTFAGGSVGMTAKGGPGAGNIGSGVVSMVQSTGCDVNGWTGPGSHGQWATASFSGIGGNGASTFLGGAGMGAYNSPSSAASANTGSGGGGGNATSSVTLAGDGGNSGAPCTKLITSPGATFTYTIGAGSSGAAAGAGGAAGQAGGSGTIIIDEMYD